MPAPTIVGAAVTDFQADGTTRNYLRFAKPAGIANGDILLVWLRCQATNWTADWTKPAGWSRVGPDFSANRSDGRVNGWYAHVVTDAGSEPANYDFTGYNTSSRREGVLIVVRGALTYPLPSGRTTNYLGTVTGTTAVTAAAITPTNTNSEPQLHLVAAASEFSSPNNHVPTAYPSGFTTVAEVVGPSSSTSVSRTYSYIGAKEVAAGATTGTATVTWAVTASVVAHAITIQGLPTPSTGPGDGFELHNGAGAAVKVYQTLPDDELGTPQDIRYLFPGYDSVDAMLSHECFWAHRGGSASFPEHSLWAYTQSALRGFGALEISLNRTSDGVWFGLHDQTLDRTTGSGLGFTDALQMTWAQVQSHAINIGAAGAPQPYMRWEELVEAYGDSHVLIVDPKYRHADYRSEFFDQMSMVNPDRVVIKSYFDNLSFRNAAQFRGLKTWGYLYESAIGSAPTNCPGWDILGLEYTASFEAWDELLTYNLPIIAHICPDEAAIVTARNHGASGFQCSGTAVITPAPAW